MHTRGFRHTHTVPPRHHHYRAAATKSGSRVVEDSDGIASGGILTRPCRYPHIAIGIQSTHLARVQQLTFLKEHQVMVTTAEGGAAPHAAAAGDSAAAATVSDDDIRFMWKEIWNVYDILYDEIDLFLSDSESLLQSVVDRTLITNEFVPPTNASFSLPSLRQGNDKIIVATHYFANGMIPDIGDDVPLPLLQLPITGPKSTLLVLDVSAMDLAKAHVKVAMEVAWLAAFATVHRKPLLLEAAAIVVKMPYSVMPTMMQLELSPHKAAQHALEGLDFLGEYLVHLYRNLARVVLGGRCASTPVIYFVGNEESELLGDIVASHKCSQITALAGDHLFSPEQLAGMSAAILAATGNQVKDACVTSVPLKALIEGEEEAWDPYTQAEMSRLNFCPCCGDCGDDEGHGHGHAH
ncbi:hypothetical protein STCU_05591 [Strigomonas culicis]|nr:hypothetical protein STCU_05591 [Strigomonas culicis]|eukprot:EPY27747.1 hypothetical protein STCU_05591 [Strigomonas culicis]